MRVVALKVPAIIALTTLLLLSLCAIGQESGGTVCVAARVDNPFWKEETRLANGQVNTHGLRLRVDKQQATEWPVTKSLKLDRLDTGKRHLLVVLDSDGKPLESLWFTFSEYTSANLCMSYDGYQGIQLHEATRRTPWCKCK